MNYIGWKLEVNIELWYLQVSIVIYISSKYND